MTLLLPCTKDNSTPYLIACAGGFADVLSLFMSNPHSTADPTVVDTEGTNALIAACSSGSVPTVRFVLRQLDTDCSATDNAGSTALNAAVRSGEVDVVRLVLEAGADANQRDGRSGDRWV